MMQNRSSKKKSNDVNTLASQIVEEVTDETSEDQEKETEEESEESTKNPHAQALGHLGGLKGGKARAAKLTAKRRKEIAQLAAKSALEKRHLGGNCLEFVFCFIRFPLAPPPPLHLV